MKSRVKIIVFPVFCDYVVHVELTTDVAKSLSKYPSTKGVFQETGITDAMSIHITNENFSYIFLRYNSSVGTIAHESWHVVKRMMEHVGIELDSETVAYHLGYLVNQIFRFARGKK